MMARIPLVATLSIAGASLAPAIHAQPVPVLEEIIVTAQKRPQNLQDVPISVSMIRGDQLRESGISDLQDVSAYVPNFSMNETVLANAITIRGISSGVNPGFEQSVGLYIDDVYYGRGQLARAPLFDLEQIEVARGPQPILFGKNSIAGAVSMTTRKPTEQFEGSLTALYEPDHGEKDVQFVLSGPVGDNIAARLSMYEREFDGYLYNTHLNRDEKYEDTSVVRGSIAWDPTDRLAFDFKLEHSQFDTIGRNIEIVNSVVLPTGGIDYLTALGGTVAAYNGAVAAGLAPPPAIPYTPGDDVLNFQKSSGTDENENTIDNFTMSIEHQLGDHVLTLVTGYLEYDFTQLCDCDGVSVPIIDGSTTTERFDQISQELRLTSPLGERLEYVAGFHFQSSSLDYIDRINLPVDGVLRAVNPALAGVDTRRSFDQDTQLLSAFAQLTWNLSDALQLTFGGRYTDENKDATRSQIHFANGTPLPPTDPTGATPNYLWALNPLFGSFLVEPYAPITAERNESRFSPLVTAQWDINDRVMTYATYVTGFKSGGFDVRSNAHPDALVVNALNLLTTPPTDIVGVFEFEDEEAQSLEVGAKILFASGRAELNAALYSTNYEDLQTSVFDGTLGFNVANASEASLQGLELDARWAVTDSLNLSASLGYLDFEFDDFRLSACYFNDPRPVTGPGTCDATGDRKEYTPEWTASIIGMYSRPWGSSMEFRATGELLYSSDYLWSPTLDPLTRQSAYTKVNLRLGIGQQDGSWEVALVARNLTDEKISTYGGNAVLAGLVTGGTGNAYYTFVDRPRSVALQGTFRFGD